jgi:amino-acid N-acetyltransferase
MLRVSSVRAELGPAADADHAPILRLLEAATLPTADLATARPDFIVARSRSRIVGVGAVETHGSVGLLRSVAVATEQRGMGLGREIVARLERHSRELGIGELVLLTETAPDFFGRLGYRVIDRNAAPEAVRQSAEFTSLCPQSAVCMVKSLSEARP